MVKTMFLSRFTVSRKQRHDFRATWDRTNRALAAWGLLDAGNFGKFARAEPCNIVDQSLDVECYRPPELLYHDGAMAPERRALTTRQKDYGNTSFESGLSECPGNQQSSCTIGGTESHTDFVELFLRRRARRILARFVASAATEANQHGANYLDRYEWCDG